MSQVGYGELSGGAINYLAAFPPLLGVSATSKTLKTHHTKEHHDPDHAAVTTETQLGLSDSTQRRWAVVGGLCCARTKTGWLLAAWISGSATHTHAQPLV